MPMPLIHLPLAFLVDSLGGSEMLLIFVIVLMLFGGKKLPEFARGMGKSIREFKKAAAGVEEEFKRALEEDERASAAKAVAPAVVTPALTAAPMEPTPTVAPTDATPGTTDTAS